MKRGYWLFGILVICGLILSGCIGGGGLTITLDPEGHVNHEISLSSAEVSTTVLIINNGGSPSLPVTYYYAIMDSDQFFKRNEVSCEKREGTAVPVGVIQPGQEHVDSLHVDIGGLSASIERELYLFVWICDGSRASYLKFTRLPR